MERVTKVTVLFPLLFPLSPFPALVSLLSCGEVWRLYPSWRLPLFLTRVPAELK